MIHFDTLWYLLKNHQLPLNLLGMNLKVSLVFHKITVVTGHVVNLLFLDGYFPFIAPTNQPTQELFDCLFDQGGSPPSTQSRDGLQLEKSRRPSCPGLSPLLQVGSVAIHRPGRCGLPHGCREGDLGGPVVGTEDWDQFHSGGASSAGAAIWSPLCGSGGGAEAPVCDLPSGRLLHNLWKITIF